MRRKKTEWIYIRNYLSAKDIWELLPHKRNEYFSDINFDERIQTYLIDSMKKKYTRRKK